MLFVHLSVLADFSIGICDFNLLPSLCLSEALQCHVTNDKIIGRHACTYFSVSLRMNNVT